jgi:hypothetical protein
LTPCSTSLELEQQVNSLLQKANQAQGDWIKNRSHGAKKVESTIQRFLTSFKKFLESFSIIANLVKGAGGMLGDAAYEALSALLAVSLYTEQEEFELLTM